MTTWAPPISSSCPATLPNIADNNDDDRFIPRWFLQTKQPRHQSNNTEAGLEIHVSICPYQRGMNEPPAATSYWFFSACVAFAICISESQAMVASFTGRLRSRCLYTYPFM
eukprot:scaffold255176_cov22-Prasinocladus_malaysianus.AAC.1